MIKCNEEDQMNYQGIYQTEVLTLHSNKKIWMKKIKNNKEYRSRVNIVEYH